MTVLHELDDLVAFVRENSPFFKEFYAELPSCIDHVTQLPVLDQEAYWAANTPRNNRLLAGPMADGWVFSSGGTTGNPKFSFFNREEFTAFTTTWTRGAVACGIQPGDRIANFLRTGQLYGAFVIISRVLELATHGSVLYPLAGTTPHDESFRILSACSINTLLGFPTVLVNTARYYLEHRAEIGDLGIERILYTGEALYPPQREILLAAFPSAQIASFGYASVDGGPLGYADGTCGDYEHRTYDPEMILEILDEDTDEPVVEAGVPGRIVVTNLTRRTMPILRYPVGDRAAWVDPEPRAARKFRLLGRASESARLASQSVFYGDIASVLERLAPAIGFLAFQMVVSRRDNLDLLTLRIAVRDPGAAGSEQVSRVLDGIHESDPSLLALVSAGRANPIEIEWIRFEDMHSNPRTGKTRRIIDTRFQDATVRT